LNAAGFDNGSNKTGILYRNGIFYIEGKPKFLLSADYPYYRDLAENWSHRLDLLKQAHVDVITFYVPWRHHLTKNGMGNTFDFEGKAKPNKNVKQFIRLCQEKNLYVILKPGPFIHAETDFGGLPDNVSPEENKSIEPMLDNRQNKREWHKVLPAPLDIHFSQEVQSWFEQVDRELIGPNTYPHGPIISLQILNEGVYSDAQHPVTDYDYSQTSKELFQHFLCEKYESMENYNRLHQTSYKRFPQIEPPTEIDSLTHDGDILAYLDWADYQSYYMAHLYREWGSYIRSELPYVLNLNPPHDREEGYDDWFNRLEIERFTNQHYGYTNWIGVVSHDTSAFNRYLLLTKRGRGPNLEENWGFSKLYDYRYKYTAIPFFQTIMAVAGGATGYNVYTGVGTDQWDDGIDTKQEKPYPDCTPITENGELTDKYFSMKLLNRFFQQFGSELLECTPYAPITWGIYNGYAQAGCWGIESELRNLGKRPVYLGKKAFNHFQDCVRYHNVDYGMINIASGQISVKDHPLLVLVGGFFMAELAQKNLVKYVSNGGTLILSHDVPQCDEKLQHCTYLRDELFGGVYPKSGVYPIGAGKVVFYEENIFESESSAKQWINILKEEEPNCFGIQSDAQVWVHKHSHHDIQYLFILGLDEEEKIYQVSYENQQVDVRLPQKSSAMIRLENGELSAGVVKGIHEFEQSYQPVYVGKDHEFIKSDKACDLYFHFTKDQDASIFEVALTGDEDFVHITRRRLSGVEQIEKVYANTIPISKK
jgi:beta-galactosidase